ncbi:hypothetical protein D3C76_978470 [compost metagenome]
MRGAQQLFLVELQSDRFVKQGTQFAVQAFEQVTARHGDIQQGLAQLRRNLLRRLAGQELVDVLGGVADLFALLVDLELVQADVSDLVGQVTVELEMRQRLLLLIEDFGQQQAAFEHADLLVKGLVALGQVVQLLLGLEVLLGQLIKAVGAAQQVVGQFDVGCAFSRQQAAATGLLCFERLLGDGLLGLGQALLVDQGL